MNFILLEPGHLFDNERQNSLSMMSFTEEMTLKKVPSFSYRVSTEP